MKSGIPLLITATLLGVGTVTSAERQYAAGEIAIPAAGVDEAIRPSFSLGAAVDYLEKGTEAWQANKKCVSCHTNGAYNQFRPALSPLLGPPPSANFEFLKTELAESKTTDFATLKKGFRPTQAAVIAHGMTEWDRHVHGSLSDSTRQALALMLRLQEEDGSWGNAECWPPFESSSYHGATVAALAVSTAPGFLAEADEGQRAAIDKLRRYLKEQAPPHDYGRLLLLWASTRMEGLVDEAQKAVLIEMALKHQQTDGGWSIRSFSTPEAWADGYRMEKLKAEPEFENPPSDGHQTGLAILVLREAGLPAEHPALQAGVAWLKANQRESGRWWTRSLNTDKQHFITYSGTIYPVMALYACGKLGAASDDTATESLR